MVRVAPSSPLISLLSAPSASHPTTLVHLKQTSLQSCAPILSELLHAATDRGEQVVLLTSCERPSSSWEVTPGVDVIPLHPGDEYEDGADDKERHWAQLHLALVRVPSGKPVTLIVESLDALLDSCTVNTDPARHVYRELQKATSALPPYSKLVFATSSPASSLQPVLQSRLVSLLCSTYFLKASVVQQEVTSSFGPSSVSVSDPSSSSNPSSSAPLLTIQLHPPALWRRLLKDYGTGLRPASTPSEVAQQLRTGYQRTSVENLTSLRRPQRRDVSAARERKSATADSDLVEIFDWDLSRKTDARLWPILAHLQATSHPTTVGGGTWFQDGGLDLLTEEIEALRPSMVREAGEALGTLLSFDPIAARVTLLDLLGPPIPGSSSSSHSSKKGSFSSTTTSSSGTPHRSRTGWGVITAHYRLPGGKFGEEAFGCISRLEKPTQASPIGSSSPTTRPRSRLRLVPLEMGDRRAAEESSRGMTTTKTSSALPNTNTLTDKSKSRISTGITRRTPVRQDHSSLVESLPFKLSLTEDQRSRREHVDLPFAPSDRIYAGISTEDPTVLEKEEDDDDDDDDDVALGLRRGSTGQSTIYFEPDSADEEDEEDPDEDLDF